MDALHDGNPVGRKRAAYNMRGKKNRFFDDRVATHLYVYELRYEDNDDGFIVKFYCPMSPYYRNDFYGLVIYIYV